MTWPQPEDVLSHHRELLAQLEFAEANEATFSATQTVGSPFFALTLDELGVAWRRQRDELDERTVLLLMASFEATFQTDRAARLRLGPRRDPLVVALQGIRARHGHIWFEHILDVWREQVTSITRIVGQLKQLVNRRHWLAHGRYFVDKSGVTATPADAMRVYQAVTARLPADFPLV
jgi:hypothetical protein